MIIPAYEAADTIAECVDSVLTQTFKAAEIIVCDDGSPNALNEALANYRRHLKLIRLPHNRGPAAARNAALHVASTEFVAMLDADDIYLPTWLEAIAELARARPDLAILTTDAFLELRGRRVRHTYHPEWPFEIDDQRMAILKRNFITSQAAVLRSAILAVGGWDDSLRWAEDWDLWLRLILSGSSAGLIREPLACYRVRPGSLSTSQAKLRRAELRVLEKALISDAALSDEERRELEHAVDHRRRSAGLEELRAALTEGAPDVRRLASRVAFSSEYAIGSRVKALAAALAPRSLGQLQRRRDRRAWVGAGHLRIDEDGS